MSDAELLDLSALAAGLGNCFYSDFLEGYAVYHEDIDCDCFWNPLESDGDALRLALQLAKEGKLRVQITEQGVDVFWYHTGVWVPHTWAFDICTPSEAFRRCVVGAAAEIGKNMS